MRFKYARCDKMKSGILYTRQHQHLQASGAERLQHTRIRLSLFVRGGRAAPTYTHTATLRSVRTYIRTYVGGTRCRSPPINDRSNTSSFSELPGFCFSFLSIFQFFPSHCYELLQSVHARIHHCLNLGSNALRTTHLIPGSHPFPIPSCG